MRHVLLYFFVCFLGAIKWHVLTSFMQTVHSSKCSWKTTQAPESHSTSVRITNIMQNVQSCVVFNEGREKRHPHYDCHFFSRIFPHLGIHAKEKTIIFQRLQFFFLVMKCSRGRLCSTAIPVEHNHPGRKGNLTIIRFYFLLVPQLFNSFLVKTQKVRFSFGWRKIFPLTGETNILFFKCFRQAFTGSFRIMLSPNKSFQLQFRSAVPPQFTLTQCIQ